MGLKVGAQSAIDDVKVEGEEAAPLVEALSLMAANEEEWQAYSQALRDARKVVKKLIEDRIGDEPRNGVVSLNVDDQFVVTITYSPREEAHTEAGTSRSMAFARRER